MRLSVLSFLVLGDLFFYLGFTLGFLTFHTLFLLSLLILHLLTFQWEKILPASQENEEIKQNGTWEYSEWIEWKSLSRVWLFATPRSVHGIPQERILEWIAMPSSRGSSWPRDQTQVSCISGRFFTIWATREAPKSIVCYANIKDEVLLRFPIAVCILSLI